MAKVAIAQPRAINGVEYPFLLFWVPFPFGFQLGLHQLSCGMSSPFGPDVLKHGVFSFQV